MSLLVIPFPGIDPVAFALGPIAVKWYGLAYAAGLILGWIYVRRLVQDSRLWAAGEPPFAVDRADDLVFWIIVAVVVGGRLGQVLLYEPGFYFAHPMEIVKVWNGGMSFHGALIGSAAAILMFARRYGVPARSVMDLCCAAIPFGMVLGRVANFINSEHWGRTTNVAWGMVFPDGGPLPRHPSQLYEAFLEGVVMICIVRLVTHWLLGLKRPGLVSGVWLVWYAIARTICEMFREPESMHALNLGPFTAGQMYSVPMLLLGLYLIATASRAADRSSATTPGTQRS
jgi:phosphatidylglycerol:prolipoprotein diacylglycerol transferase